MDRSEKIDTLVILDEIAHALPLGIVILDPEGHASYCNAAGRDFLEGEGILTDGLEERPLQHLFKNRGFAWCGMLRTRVLSKIQVCAILRGGYTLFLIGERAHVDPRYVAKLYGLSAAPARVASDIAGGKDLYASAADNGIQYETARKHLKAAFDAMGVHRQSELVSQVLAGPAPLMTELNKGSFEDE